MYFNCLFCLFTFKSLFRFSLSSLVSFGCLCAFRILSILSRLSHLLVYNCSKLTLGFFKFLSISINSLTFICVFNKLSLIFFMAVKPQIVNFDVLFKEVTFGLSILLSYSFVLSFLKNIIIFIIYSHLLDLFFLDFLIYKV